MENSLKKLSSENQCLIICPYCNSEMDYGKVNTNLHRGEEDITPCLACKKFIKLISIGGALKVEKM